MDLEAVIEQSGGSIVIQNLPVIEADPSQMRRLLQNLISNGLKFHGEEKPVVRIYGRPVEGQLPERVQIVVEDNGIGFAEKDAERIFRLFERLHGRSRYEGTGMGLAICRKIVDRHCGTLMAKGAPGKGATFILTLPVKQARRDFGFDCEERS